MKKKTDLNYVRKIAECFLDTDIIETQVPFVAHHPFTSSWTVYIKDDGFKLVDLHEAEHAAKWRNYYKEEIRNADLLEIFAMLNKPYILNFLKFVANSLSDEDLGLVLGSFWQSIEVISLDNSITGREIVKWFSRADKNALMNDNEREIFDSLPEQITIYRGVTSYNKKKKKAFSWTTNKEIALWFANRFSTGTGEVWTMTVPKDRIVENANGYTQTRPWAIYIYV